MKAILWITAAAAALSFIQPTPASAGVGDPEVIIYRFPGVHNGGPTGLIATLFHCTNFSGQDENVRFVTRFAFGATIASNVVVTIPHLQTRTVGTNKVQFYHVEEFLNVGSIGVQGTTAIAATSTNIICTAMVVNAAATVPDGISLHGIRFSPVPGSQE